MLWHHIIGAGGILLGIGSGFVAPGVCSITLLSEFCSIFLIFREMQENKFSPHPLSMLNQTVFVASYTFLRVILIPYGLYVLVRTTYLYTFELLPLWRKVAVVWAVLQVVLLSIFNFFWYYKMLVGLFKMFGCIKSRSGKTGMGSVEEFLGEEAEQTELVNANKGDLENKNKDQDQDFNRIN